MDFLADTSYKQSQAEVIGSLTASAVATGSQLVGYSGFSNEAFIREPASTDLDFGTGEWSASAWMNIPANLSLDAFPASTTNLFVSPIGTNIYWVDNGDGSFTCSNGVGSQLQKTGLSSDITGMVITFSVIQGSVNIINGVGSYVTGNLGAGTYTIRFNQAGGYVGIRAATVPAIVANITINELTQLTLSHRAANSGASLFLGIKPQSFITSQIFDGTTLRIVTSTAAYNTGTWLKVDTYYKTDGSLSIAVNGQQVATTGAQTPLLTLNNSNAVLTIGNNYSLTAPFPGSIALLKLSATVPTTEQLQWMYEQEKQMFQSGVQITLPNTENILDLTYDDGTLRVIAVSTSTESYWSGLVRVAAAPASTSSAYTRVAASSGIRLVAQSTTDPGVYISRATSGLNSQLNSRAVPAATRSALLTSYDYVGGVTAISTSGSTVLTSVTGLSVPAAVNLAGTRITGTGIVTGTTITSVVGNAIYLSTATTVSTSSVQVSFVDFPLPIGYETRAVLVAGTAKQEGASATWTRLYDGFRESVTFGTAPGYNVWVQIQAVKSSS